MSPTLRIVSCRRNRLKLGVSVGALLLAAAGAHAAETAAADQTVAHPIETVVVTGTAEDGYRIGTAKSTGVFGTMSLKDAPYSITVTSAEMIENTDAHSLADMLKTNPSVYVVQTPFNSASGMNDSLIRGFDPMYMRDGHYFNTYNMPSLENLEGIEVMNGLTGFHYGFANPGGTINYVTKQPTEDRIINVKAGEYGGGQFFGNLDLGGAVDEGKAFTYRATLYGSDGDTYVDRQKYRALYGMVKLRYRVAPDSWVQIHYYHNEFHETGAQSEFSLDASSIDVPKAPDPTKLYGQPWSQISVGSEQMGFDSEIKLSESVSFRMSYNHSYMNWHTDYIAGSLVDNLGNYSQTYYHIAPQYYVDHTGYAFFDIKFDVLGTDNVVTYGYWGRNGWCNTVVLGDVDIGTFSMQKPSYASYTDWKYDYLLAGFNSHYNSMVLGDRITFDEHWSAIAGVTSAWYKQQGGELQHALTPTASLIYKPAKDISVYASYIEALSESSRAPITDNGYNVANAGELLSPAVSRQYEIGTKATIFNIDISAALYRISVASSQLDLSDYIYKNSGREIHQGGEFYATGKLTDDLALTGGFTVYDAHIKSSTADTATEGKTPMNTPESYGSLRLEYELPFVQNMFVSAGMRYLGKRPVDNYDTQYIDAITTFDIGWRYQMDVANRPVTATLNVTNLFDEHYWAAYNKRSYDGGGLQLGSSRQIAFSIKTSL
jgi:iron complex outermembrane recepter protein